MPVQRTHKLRPAFREITQQPKTYARFTPIPVPQPANCVLPFSAVFSAEDIAAVQKARRIVFHTVGDTGGYHGTNVQDAIAEAIEGQYEHPSFFYHLGDVIYFNGQSYYYPTQFYEPYQYYPGYIFAIPGNHDGDVHVRPGDAPDPESSLYGFFENFCASHSTQVSAYRSTMTQPYVYWTLKAPFVTIIGLYGNVDGTLDGRGTAVQQQWLTSQLKEADPTTCIVIAVHQPPYSLDRTHRGYPPIANAIDQATQDAQVWPHVVLSGHVHNYQRFTRHLQIKDQHGRSQERDIPYLISGAGGYANTPQLLHKVDRVNNQPVPGQDFQTTMPGVVLNNYNDTDPGFLRITVDDAAHTFTAEYFLVPFSGTPPAAPFDSVKISYA